MASCISIFSDNVGIFINNRFKNDFIAKMREKGVSEGLINRYKTEMSVFVANREALKDNLQKVKDFSDEKTKQYKIIEKDSKNSNRDYNPQNATQGFDIPEPIISSKVKVINQEPISYRLFKKPHIKAYIDKVANLVLVNLKKHSIQMLHYKSGSQFKIDNKGNVTLHIKGNLKFLVEGDSSMEVRGSSSKVIGKDYFEDIGSNKTLMIGNGYKIDVGAKTELTSSSGILFNNKFEVKDSVSFKSDLKVASNVNFGANLTIAGVSKDAIGKHKP